MKKGKFAKRGHRGAANKTLALILSMVLIIGCVAGGTLAWLTDKTNEVKNTFTDSNIDITLTETKSDFQMIPGWTIEKDPIVTVKAGSEDCWVFVEVEASENLTKFISYEIDKANWTKLEGVDGVDNVYYAKYTSRDDVDIAIKILQDNQVKVLDTVTKADMDGLTEATQPTLSFKAYAVQLYKDNNTEFQPAEAWAKIAG